MDKLLSSLSAFIIASIATLKDATLSISIPEVVLAIMDDSPF